jgi:hypothetical protein
MDKAWKRSISNLFVPVWDEAKNGIELRIFGLGFINSI